MPVLRVEGLLYRRAGDAGGFALAVDTLQLDRSEVLAITGPSGCGKSTLLDVLALLRPPSVARHFELMGEDVLALWRERDVDRCTALRAQHVGVVLQTGGLLPSLPLLENVRLGQDLLGWRDDELIDRLLQRLELQGLERRLPAQLSIGQRQRVAIARALAHKPALVLADEPTASLGADHAGPALDLLLALAREDGAAVVIVTHDVALLASRRVPMRRLAAGAQGVMVLEPA
ncbi:ATP-binding cassette domain-containing protein [Aquincola sp. S2]|uniref:ATP-binding cassette domain-containing protein n=1 Tax=Pseudaquabacterium terrae TaxID=2732868 RepID=A0ABX2EEN9_9BURK|nr:ATP-binding cassette domain-containing protein [Aquabacterium terrae]NRF67073.1 ATP-binding cassette domain-containing protein [Aquabacterium terrae]